MITTSNYLTKSKSIDFNKLPAKFQTAHEQIMIASDDGADWKGFMSDSDMVKFLNGYIPALNKAVSKPAKTSTKKLVAKMRSLKTKIKGKNAHRAKLTTKRKERPKASSTPIFVDTKNNVVVVPSAKGNSAPAAISSSRSATKKSSTAKSTKQSSVSGKPKTNAKATVSAKPVVTKPSTQKLMPTGKRKASMSLADKKKERERLKQERIAIANKEGKATMTAAQVIAIGKRLNAQRYASLLQVDTDTPTTNKRRLSPNYTNLVLWAEKPGRYDLIGVDSAGLTDITVYKKRDTAKPDKPAKSATKKKKK